MTDKSEGKLVAILDELKSTTRWVLLFAIALFVGVVAKNDPIEIIGVKVPRHESALLVFAILTGTIFQIMRLFHLFSGNICERTVNGEELDAIRHHTWALNPFSEHTTWLSVFADGFGYALLILLWWIGAFLGCTLVVDISATSSLKVWTRVVFLVYLVIGVILLPQLTVLIWRVSEKRWLLVVKIILAVASVLIGVILLGDLLDKAWVIKN